MRKKITTFLMFEGNAEEAMNFYISLFDDSKITGIQKYGRENPTGEGTVQQATFELNGQEYMCIDSANHRFTFTPAISLYVNCNSENEIDQLFGELSKGGKILMALGNYGFSEKFGWTEDRFGVSWQLNYEVV